MRLVVGRFRLNAELLRKDQCRFYLGHGAMDQIFTLAEEGCCGNLTIHFMCFVDLVSAYYCFSVTLYIELLQKKCERRADAYPYKKKSQVRWLGQGKIIQILTFWKNSFFKSQILKLSFSDLVMLML